MPQRHSEVHGGNIADHHQVDIAIASFLAAGYGPVHKGERNLGAEWFQGVGQNIDETSRLQQQAPQIGKQRRICVRLVVNHASLPVAFQYPGFSKIMEFTLQAGGWHSQASGEFRDVPRLRGLYECRRQDSLPGLRQQRVERAPISQAGSWTASISVAGSMSF